jgi:transposase
MASCEGAQGQAKRKRICLDISEKEVLIKKLHKGDSYEKLAHEYNVSVSTIRKLQKKGVDEIKKYRHEYPSNVDRKVLRLSPLHEVEKALKIWYFQRKHQNINVSYTTLIEKAKHFHNLIYPKPNEKKYAFSGSNGFIHNFGKRNGMTSATEDDKQLIWFLDNFRKTFLNGAYTKDQLYNASEAGLFHKSLPIRTVTSPNETSIVELKESKDRITIMPCANASGTHQLPLVIIGKAPIPPCYSGASSLDSKMYYISSKSAWMTRDIFTVWFHTEFVPQVKTFLRSKSLPEKAILFIDSCQAHPQNLRDGDILVMFLPQNTSSLIQPMNQGPIAAIKRKYRTQLVRNIRYNPSFLKQIHMKEVILLLIKIWAEVNDRIEASWNNFKLFPQIDSVKEENNTEIIDNLSSINLKCTSNQVDEWLHSDDFDVGIQLLNDDEIVQEVLEIKKNDIVDDNDDSTVQIDPNQIPSFKKFLLNHPQILDYEKKIFKSFFERISRNSDS